MEIQEHADTVDIACPQCQHVFAIRKACSPETPSEECSWEEHGEPRKTILSSLKPYTNKPMMASFLLLMTSVLGIFTAVVLVSTEELVIPYLNVNFNMVTEVIGTAGLSIVLIVFSCLAFVGFVAAFFSGLIACKWMINLVKKGKLITFAIYCTIIGTFVILFG